MSDRSVKLNELEVKTKQGDPDFRDCNCGTEKHEQQVQYF